MRTTLSDIDGMAIRRQRRRQGLKQGDLADRVGCSRNSITRAESGYASEALAARIAMALKVDLDTLRLAKPAAELAQGVVLTTREKRVVEIMRMSDDLRDAIWQYALGAESMHERLSGPRDKT